MLNCIVLALLILLLPGCAGSGRAARLTVDTPRGGVAVYSFEDESDLLTSTDRRAAIGLIAEKCPGGYSVTREGEVSRVSRGIDQAWRGQMGTDRQWAIEFRCK